MYKLIGGDQREYGPVTAEQLRLWIAEGRLNAQSLVREEGTGDWKKLGDLPEFAPALAAKASVSPPPVTVAASLSAEEILARTSGFSVQRCLAKGWELYKANFGLLLGAILVVIAIELVAMLIPFLGGLAHMVIMGPLHGGLFLIVLKRIRGLPGRVGDVFAGFQTGFLHLMLASILVSILTGIGFLFCLLPGIYLTVAWIFAIPLIIDKQLEFWPGMELSRRIVTAHWWRMFGFLIILGLIVSLLPMLFVAVALPLGGLAAGARMFGDLPPWLVPIIVGAAGYVIGLLVTAPLVGPFVVGALMHAYEEIFGSRPAETA